MGGVHIHLSQAEQGPDPARQLSGGAGGFPPAGKQVPVRGWYSLDVYD